MKFKNNDYKLTNLKAPIGQMIKSFSNYCKQNFDNKHLCQKIS